MESLKPSFYIHDDRFAVEDLQTKELVLELQLNKFVFIVKCLKSQEIQWIEDYSLPVGKELERLEVIFRSHLFLKANFWNKIKIVYHPSFKTLVPKAYYDHLKLEELLPDYEDSKEYQASFLHSNQVLLFRHQNGFIRFLERVYPKKQFSLMPMDSFLPICKNGVNLHFENNNFTIQKFDHSRLIQSKCYFVNGYLHFKKLIEQIDINASKKILLFGEITTYSKYFMILSDYFETIRFGIPDINIKTSQYFIDIPRHKYLTILNASCF